MATKKGETIKVTIGSKVYDAVTLSDRTPLSSPLSTTTTRTSQTLVCVGPVLMSAPNGSKK